MLRLIILIRTGWLCLTLSVTLLSKCYLYNSSNTCRVPVNQILKIFKYRALSDALAMSSVMSYCNQTHCLNSFQTLEETLRLCVPFFFFFWSSPRHAVLRHLPVSQQQTSTSISWSKNPREEAIVQNVSC